MKYCQNCINTKKAIDTSTDNSHTITHTSTHTHTHTHKDSYPHTHRLTHTHTQKDGLPLKTFSLWFLRNYFVSLGSDNKINYNQKKLFHAF